jgi:protein SCO1
MANFIMKNSKTILALLLAIMVPVVSYVLVKYYSERAVSLPHRYFYDSVAVTEKKGKTQTDTIWHKVENIQFVNQQGKTVSLDDLKGKIIVLDFFFTRCPTQCPGMTRAMKKLQDSFVKNDTIVQFLSISVDPAYDSVPQLKRFADKYNVDPGSWWLLTGKRNDIYSFALNEIHAGLADTEVDSAFIHTPNFFLLDKQRVVRGWYDGSDSVAQSKLVRDIPLLMLEKDKKRSFGDFLKELFGRS